MGIFVKDGRKKRRKENKGRRMKRNGKEEVFLPGRFKVRKENKIMQFKKRFQMLTFLKLWQIRDSQDKIVIFISPAYLLGIIFETPVFWGKIPDNFKTVIFVLVLILLKSKQTFKRILLDMLNKKKFSLIKIWIQLHNVYC